MKNSKLFGEKFSKQAYSNFYSFINILPNPDKILSKLGKTYDTLRDLKNDAHLWSCIQSRKSGSLSLDWGLMGNTDNPNQRNFIENILKNLDMHKIIRDILEAPLFGFQPIEIIWDYDKNNNMIYPLDLVAKPQEWFEYDSSGKIYFISQNKRQQIDKYKLLEVKYEASYINPYGISLLSKCYWLVTFKKASMRFWVNFAEKFGIPILLGKYTRGASRQEIEDLANSLVDMAEDSVLVTPVDIDLVIHEANKSSSIELFKELIKFCNGEISKTILSQTLTTELDMGSYAAAQTHFKVRKEVILSDIRLVESTINKLIKYIYELNKWHSSQLPSFKIFVNEADNEQRIDRDIKLVQSGILKFSKKYLIDNYGFKEDEIIINHNKS